VEFTVRFFCSVSFVSAGCLLAGFSMAAPVAEVLAVRGSVGVVTAGRNEALTVGQALEEGQEIRSASPGRAKLRFIDGSVVVVGDGSSLRIERFRLAANQPREASFVLDTGLVSQTVRPSTKGSWTVRTPSVVTAVRGTEFIVDVRSDQQTEVAVQSGAVAVEPAPDSVANRLGRSRGFSGQSGPPQVVLDRRNSGTTCSREGDCEASRPWSPDKLRAVNDRLSGV
jgi:hypothetical protein